MLIVDPPILLDSMTMNEQSNCIIALGLRDEAISRLDLRLKLNLVFQSVGVKQEFITQYHYYIGTTGAVIAISAPSGHVVDHSGPTKIQVEVESTTGVQTGVEAKSQTAGVSLGKSKTSRAKFPTEELLLVPINLQNGVKWHIDNHRGDKAIRDFLLGNVYLQATFRWDNGEKRGTVEARPSDIRFFDDKKRLLLSLRTSILMLFRLYRQKKKLVNPDGILVTFKEQ